MKHLQLILFICVVFSAFSVNGQTKPLPKTISGGVVNGKATSLPKPDYPDDARQAKITGVVKVQVLIDETGRVVSAVAVSGPESVSLKQAAEAAALKATFSPTLLAGRPTKVSGIISYNFIEKSNEEKLRVFAVSSFLGTARLFASDLNGFNKAFESDDLFKETSSEFSEFKELQVLSSLEGLTVDKRLEAIEKASSSIKSGLNTSERWQFEAGQDFSGLLGPFLLAGVTEDLSKFDSETMKLNLNKMRDLLPSAPSDFPPDVLEKLKEVCTLGSKDNLLSEKNVKELFGKLEALLETISPGSTK